MHPSQSPFVQEAPSSPLPYKTGRVEIQIANFNTLALPEGLADSAQLLSSPVIIEAEITPSNEPSVELITSNCNKHREKRDDTALAPLPAMPPLTIARGAYKLTPQLQEQVCLLLQAGFSRRQAAAYLHLSPSTITHAAARDEDFAASLVRAEELGMLQTDLCVIAASRKNWRAAAWLIEQRRKHPAPLTKEEKQVRHEERMADLERDQEYQLRSNVLLHEQMTASVTGQMPERLSPSTVPPESPPSPRKRSRPQRK